ncbi:hypothetical protein DFH11DRAFT_1576521, partial [Phellopilus nigrolimitatus]
MDSALCDADSSTSSSDTCVDSFSSPEKAAEALPSKPSATLVPAEMHSAPSPSTADEVPEVAEKQVAWVKRPANRRGGGGPARKRAREQRVAIFKDMPFWEDADDASPASTADNVAPSASSASTSDSVASSEPSIISSASTPDDASPESSVPPRMSVSTARASLADAAGGRERGVPDKCDRRSGPNSNDRGPSGSETSSDSQGLSNGYRCHEDHKCGERRDNSSCSSTT